MPNNSRLTNTDWDPYTEDVISRYIMQNKTAEETVQYLRETRGLEVTLKQFKHRFNRLKKITEQEWTTGIIPATKKRALEGKDSDVYFNGGKLDSKRLKTAIDRYSAKVSQEFMDLDTSTVIGQNPSDRLYITTPSCHSGSPSIDPSPETEQDAADATLPETPVETAICIPPESVASSSPSWRSPISLFHENNYLYNFSFDEDPPLPFSTPTVDGGLGLEDHVQEVAGITSTNIDIFSELPFGQNFILGVPQFAFLANLPYIQLRHHILQNNTACSPVVIDCARSSLSIDSPSTNGPFDALVTTRQSLQGVPAMLANIIGFSYSNRVGNVIPSIVTKLQALLPEQCPGELNAQVQTLSDPSQKPHIFQLFEVASFLFSNNILGMDRKMTFVRWVIEHNHIKSLMLFLRQRRDMPTAKSFLVSLVEPGAYLQNKDFLRQLHAIGAKFDNVDVVEQIIQINDAEFLAFIIRTLPPDLLKGESGGRLLRYVARTSHIEVAEQLIKAGADVNLSLSPKVPTSPLWEAVIQHANFEMVKILVGAGADVNESVYKSVGNWVHNTPLALAVRKEDKRLVEYLLDQNAKVQGFVDDEPLLEYAEFNVPDLYQLLLKKSERPHLVTVSQVLEAANSGDQRFSEFLSQRPQVSEIILEKALVSALEKREDKAVVNLLQHGVDPNGSHLPTESRPLYTVVTGQLDLSTKNQYMDLLIHAKADVNVDGLLDTLVGKNEFLPSIIDKLINAGLDLTRYGPAAIEAAVEIDNKETLLFLANKGIPFDHYGHRFTPFQAVARRQSPELLQHLFERGADINKPPFPIRGCTALQAAAKDGSIEKIQFLLSKGANINTPPAVTGGVTALEATVRPWQWYFDEDSEDGEYYEDTEVVESFVFLLENDAEVNRSDGSSSPLLHDIIERRNTHLLKLALEAGANTTNMWGTYSSSCCERTPLQLAAEMGQVEALKLLLHHKADPNASPAVCHGRTALQAAASSETACMETVKLLLAANAAINADPAAIGGISALQGAAIKGNFEIALFLIEKGANVNARPAMKDGRTAIEGAAEYGRLDMVQMLLNAAGIGDVT
ncbi:ankyrin repeat-containing domain protein [Mariannaea sp. PMI_226]|nr:ankyrin repeat-containing domain protein [Mariannaea sp. PMI_226]